MCTANDLQFFHAAFFLEDLGVTAYRGLTPLLNGREFISVASGILGAEAMHAGACRWRLSDRLAVITPWNQPVWRIVNAISAYRQRLTGGCVSALCCACVMLSRRGTLSRFAPRRQMIQDVGLLQPVAQSSLAQAQSPRTFAGGNAIQIASVEPNTGLVFSRTPQQVLAVLYGTGDASKPGLFFPRGVNGNIKG